MPVRPLVLILLCVAACAAPPAPTATAPEPEPLPASPLARAALAEWEAWGRIVIEGWPAARPADTAATAERFNRLMDYWSTVPGGRGVANRMLTLRYAIAAAEPRLDPEIGDGDGAASAWPAAAPSPEDLSLYEYPAWSAAFISSVARRAGLPESDLPSAYRHSRYIDAVIARALADPLRAPFRPHAPEDQAPAPGDLLCADRAYYPLTHWSRRLAERGRPRPMHCDVVVRLRPGVVEAVGGNVQGQVALRRFPADDLGRVLPAPYGRPPFVLILAARGPDEPAPATAAPLPELVPAE